MAIVKSTLLKASITFQTSTSIYLVSQQTYLPINVIEASI